MKSVNVAQIMFINVFNDDSGIVLIEFPLMKERKIRVMSR